MSTRESGQTYQRASATLDFMHNWDYDLSTLQSGPAAERWMLERMINYDLKPGERIPLRLLRKHFTDLHMPEDHRWFLQLFL